MILLDTNALLFYLFKADQLSDAAMNTITYSDIVSYYKGLIEIRKAYAPFRDPTNTSNNTIYFHI